jgi:hypothetical protein
MQIGHSGKRSRQATAHDAGADGNGLRRGRLGAERRQPHAIQARIPENSLHEGTNRATGTFLTWSRGSPFSGAGPVDPLGRASGACAAGSAADLAAPSCRQVVAKRALEAPGRVPRLRVARSAASTPGVRARGTSGVAARERRAANVSTQHGAVRIAALTRMLERLATPA